MAAFFAGAFAAFFAGVLLTAAFFGIGFLAAGALAAFLVAAFPGAAFLAAIFLAPTRLTAGAEGAFLAVPARLAGVDLPVALAIGGSLQSGSPRRESGG